jgi:hypothetical protein
MLLLQEAEQVAREVAARRPEIALLDLDVVSLPSGPVVIVSVQTPRDPEPEAIGRFEAMLRERLAMRDVQVVIRRIDSTDLTAKGKILYGAAHFGSVSEEEKAGRVRVEAAVRARIEAVQGLFVTAVDAVRAGSDWGVRAEVVGARVPTTAEIRAVEQQARAAVGAPVHVSVRARVDLVVDARSYKPLGEARPAAAP